MCNVVNCYVRPAFWDYDKDTCAAEIITWLEDNAGEVPVEVDLGVVARPAVRNLRRHVEAGAHPPRQGVHAALVTRDATAPGKLCRWLVLICNRVWFLFLSGRG